MALEMKLCFFMQYEIFRILVISATLFHNPTAISPRPFQLGPRCPASKKRIVQP